VAVAVGLMSSTQVAEELAAQEVAAMALTITLLRVLGLRIRVLVVAVAGINLIQRVVVLVARAS